jgi:hypothetical protein
MLHLLPVKRWLTVVITLVGLLVLAGVYAGYIGTGDAIGDAKWIIRGAAPAAVACIIVPYALWRWLPLAQRFTFPYLGGDWKGKLEYTGPNGTGTRDVTLRIRHSLFGLILVLDSAESTSRTLVVQADRDLGIQANRLYYIYRNERKEGVIGAGETYRGYAVLTVEELQKPCLRGTYVTERSGTGTLFFRRRRPNPWIQFWT